MCELCRVEEGLSRREQLVRYFYKRAPSRRGLLSG